MRVRVGVMMTVQRRVSAQQVGYDPRRNERRQDVERQHMHVSAQRQPESTEHVVHVNVTLQHLIKSKLSENVFYFTLQ